MRHNKKINHLGKTAPHRKAMLANMATSLILNKRINTTVAKAKALRKYVEPLITKSKQDDTHSRRTVFSYLQDKEASKVLFNEVSEKVMERPGGYTRIIKLGNRLGDNAEMAMIELVDYNSLYGKEEESKAKSRTRRGRSRRGGKKTKGGEEQSQAAPSSSQGASEAAVAEPETNEESQQEEKPKGNQAESGEQKSKGGEEAQASSKSSDEQKKDEKQKGGSEDQGSLDKDENKGKDKE